MRSFVSIYVFDDFLGNEPHHLVSLFPNFIVHLGGIGGVFQPDDGSSGIFSCRKGCIRFSYIHLQEHPQSFTRSRTLAKLSAALKCFAVPLLSTVAIVFSCLTAIKCQQLSGTVVILPQLSRPAL